jgi:hypothetical protein
MDLGGGPAGCAILRFTISTSSLEIVGALDGGGRDMLTNAEESDTTSGSAVKQSFDSQNEQLENSDLRVFYSQIKILQLINFHS